MGRGDTSNTMLFPMLRELFQQRSGTMILVLEQALYQPRRIWPAADSRRHTSGSGAGVGRHILCRISLPPESPSYSWDSAWCFFTPLRSAGQGNRVGPSAQAALPGRVAVVRHISAASYA